MNINTLKKAVIVIVMAGAIVAFKVFNLGQYLALAYMKESQQNFLSLYAEYRIAVIAGYPTLFINPEKVWRKNILCDTLANIEKIHSVISGFIFTIQKTYRFQDVLESYLLCCKIYE